MRRYIKALTAGAAALVVLGGQALAQTKTTLNVQ